MKRKTEALLFAVGLAATACSTDTDLSDRPLFGTNANSTLQVRLVDGVTGATLTDGDVVVDIGVHTMTAELQSNGYYVINRIPAGTFPIRATAAGHHDFANTFAFSSGTNYYTRNLIMFPEGNVAEDLTVTVYDTDGAVISGATVVAQLTGAAAIIDATSSLLPDTTLIPAATSGITSATGVATIPATSLLLGATYTINVFNAVDGVGNYLVVPNDTDVTVGDDFMNVTYYMELPPTTITARSVNNEDGELHSTLVITFPYAMELCSDAEDADWYNNTDDYAPYTDDRDGDGISAQAADTNPVTITWSSNNTVLTLGYVVDSTNASYADDTGDSLWVVFHSVQVAIRGASECEHLGNIEIRDTGDDIDTEIWVRDVEIP